MAAGGVLGLIPARAGSKGIPGKNLKHLAGRPLLEYTVRAAQESGVIDRVILSTDSQAIAAAGEQLGVEVPFLRPAKLAGDNTPMLPVLEHAVAALEQHGWRPEIVVLLQPTSPLRQPQHITAAVDLLRRSDADSVVSVTEVPRHLSPDYVMKIENDRLEHFLAEGKRVTRRQDARPAYARDGTVYVVWRDVLMERHTIYGDNCCPLLIAAHQSLTLDSLEDWELAELRLSRNASRENPHSTTEKTG